MERKRGKFWKLPTFEGKLVGFISYLSEMKAISMSYNSSPALRCGSFSEKTSEKSI